MVEVKREEDEPGYEPPSSPPNASHAHAPSQSEPPAAAASASTAPETAAMDNYLASTDFHERIHLVKREDGRLWPALKFAHMGELQEAMQRDVKVPQLAHLKRKVLLKGGFIKGGIAYLLGRRKIKRSLVALTEDTKAEDFYSIVGAGLRDKEWYKDDREFQDALALAWGRLNEYDSDGEPSPVKQERLAADSPPDAANSDDDSATVSLNPSVANDQTVDLPNTIVNTNNHGSDTVSALDSPLHTSDQGKVVTVGGKKRKGEGQTESQRKKAKKKQANTNPGKTPKAKATNAPVVTPAIAKTVADDKKILEELISPIELGEPYNVISDDEARKLLEAHFGLTYDGERYYLPFQERAIATSLRDLRKDLCANGLPECTVALEETEKVDIARWVRYANVTGLAEDPTIEPSRLGLPINKFMDGWSILTRKFGCHYSSGTYTVPLSPSGGDKKRFDNYDDCRRHFAHHGLQCIPPENVSEEILSKEQRLGLEIYFATPPFRVLNTFEREASGSSRRRRTAVTSYAEA